ncbi:MAG TPA: sensor histidine kinase [Gaiellaceae bacterium]|nr:sensor histidine kinase [Gaiellaceae bacterium]
MRRLRTIAGRHVFDAFIVLAAVESTLEVLLRDATDGPTSPLWFAAPASALIVLPLLARRRFPFAAPVTVWVIAAAISFVDERLVPFLAAANLAGLAAAYLLGNLRDSRQGQVGLLVVVASAAVVMVNNPTTSTGELVAVPLLFALGWLAGFLLRGRSEQAEAAEARAAQAERERDAAMRIAVAEERARIARELHDVVAHAVSVMVLQVGAVRHKLPAPLEEDREALGRVEDAGRTALAEMRRLLGAMRREGDGVALTPQPGLDGLERLVEEIGRAGLPVRLHVDGDPFPLPRALDLSAYRIVQEGLTNALKHAEAAHADVTVRYARDGVQVEVRDDGRGTAAGDGLGHGLVGIRERVTIFGGEMSAGTAPDGGFLLTARLPLEETRS